MLWQHLRNGTEGRHNYTATVQREREREAGPHLVSRGTLLLSTQLSCSCTDSGVVGASPGALGGAWTGLRLLLSVLRLRELAEV